MSATYEPSKGCCVADRCMQTGDQRLTGTPSLGGVRVVQAVRQWRGEQAQPILRKSCLTYTSSCCKGFCSNQKQLCMFLVANGSVICSVIGILHSTDVQVRQTSSTVGPISNGRTGTRYQLDANAKRKSVLKRRSFRTQQVNQHTFLCTASMAQKALVQATGL